MKVEGVSRQTLRILHLEDSPQDAELIREQLKDAGFDLRHDWTDNQRTFTAFLQRGEYDLVLADYQLPGFEAPAALALTKTLCPGLPFIVVSGAIGEEKAVELLRQGATDYVLKDRLDKLPLAIRRALDEIGEQKARQRAEEKLLRERSLLRCIIDSTSDLIFVKDCDLIYLACNKASEEYVGLAEAEQVGKSDLDFFDEPIARQIREVDRKVIEGGATLRNDEWVTYPDGRRVLLDTLKAPFYGSDGKIQGVVGISRDITERKEAEQERREYLQFLENLDRVNRVIQGANNFEQMMRDVLDVAVSGLDCDRAFLVHPCDPEAASWHVAMERTRPDYSGALSAEGEIAMDTEVACMLRELLGIDGPLIFGPDAGHPLPENLAKQLRLRTFMSLAIYPKVGKPWQLAVHSCSSTRDWTTAEEKLLEEIGRRLADGLSSLLSARELQESETKYRRIVDTASEGILVLGPDNLVTFSNLRMAEMLGESDRSLIGRPLTDFMFEEDTADHLQQMERRRRGLAGSYERRFRRRDGTTVWVLVSATPIRDDAGSFGGSFGMFTDITERKEAEEALHQLNLELESRVKKRTVELEEKNVQLERMNKLFVGRELRMVELKKKITALEQRLSQSAGITAQSGAEGMRGRSDR